MESKSRSMSIPSPLRSLRAFCALSLLAASLPAQSGSSWTIAQEYVGKAPDERFGMFVDGAGDVNGDGVPDVLVGSFYADPGGRKDAGAASVHSGLDGSEIHSWEGAAPNDQMGRAVCRMGDVDGDGFADVAVGSWGHDANGLSNNGRVTIYSGRTGGIIHDIISDLPEARFGRYIRNAGDVDADGVLDVAIGAFGTSVGNEIGAGAAWVVSGATGQPIHKFWGQRSFDGFGRAVSGAGDLDGDGHDEVLVGAWQADNNGAASGSVYLYDGATGQLKHRFDGLAAGDSLGRSVIGIGDATGDGVPDLVLAAYLADRNGLPSAGEAYLYSGADYSLVHTFTGEAAYDTFGWFVEGAGDADGDGLDDFMVGAYQADPGGRDRAGSVYLYSGGTGALIERFDGGVDSPELGRCCAPIGDVDGDGREDLLLGADTADRNGMIATGAVYLMASNLGVDTDSDGISDAVETLRGLDPADDDSDDDGILDGEENRTDTTSALAFDSDGDLLGDGMELGRTVGGTGTDPLVFVPDADPATTTHPLLADTDRGQFRDGYEDLDLNGRVDPGEGDPNDPRDDRFPIEVLNPTPGSSAVVHTWRGRRGATNHLAYSAVGSGPNYAGQIDLVLSLTPPVVLLSAHPVDATGQMWALLPVPPTVPHGKSFWFQVIEELGGTHRLSDSLEVVTN
jgi:hypothetical protein